jgi:hypothetical protein
MGMRRFVVLGTVFVAIGCGASAPSVPDCPTPTPRRALEEGDIFYSQSYRFRNEATCFTAVFPAPPRVTREDKPSALGTIASTTFSAATAAQFYFVNVIHLPWMMSTLASHNKVRLTVKDEFLTQANAKALSTEDIKLQGHNALLMHYERKSGDLGNAYIVAVRNRVYLVVGQSTKPGSTGPADFLKSFKIDEDCVKKL